MGLFALCQFNTFAGVLRHFWAEREKTRKNLRLRFLPTNPTNENKELKMNDL